ncbi:MAG: hypothetical protein LBL39_01325 [Planctomycetaceae bacterium]|nr:hypothetical protein [Planctomycetaceae bacterium]
MVKGIFCVPSCVKFTKRIMAIAATRSVCSRAKPIVHTGYGIAVCRTVRKLLLT